ncbi:MAG: class I SAM-dependent methyltransferase [Myxococcota bacterium]
MTFKDHFSSHAADYASFRPTYPRELVDYLASLGGAHDLAYDAGCGTGQLSVLLADRYARVRATDASAEQIAKAAPHPRVTYAALPAEHSGLAASSTDLVTVAQAAHWFDLPAFYGEVRRIAKQDAVIALITYGITEADGPLGELVATFYHEVVGPFWPPERAHVENGYRDLPFPFAETTAPAIAMRAHWGAHELLGYISTWSAIRPAEKKLGREPFAKFHEEVTAAIGDQRVEIRWPLALRVARV